MKTKEEILEDKPDTNGMYGFQTVCNAMQEYAEQFEPKWISLDQQKPELNKLILVTTKKYDLVLSAAMLNDEGTLFGVKFVNGQYHELISVQFWMPLPQPPKTEEL